MCNVAANTTVGASRNVRLDTSSSPFSTPAWLFRLFCHNGGFYVRLFILFFILTLTLTFLRLLFLSWRHWWLSWRLNAVQVRRISKLWRNVALRIFPPWTSRPSRHYFGEDFPVAFKKSASWWSLGVWESDRFSESCGREESPPQFWVSPSLGFLPSSRTNAFALNSSLENNGQLQWSRRRCQRLIHSFHSSWTKGLLITSRASTYELMAPKPTRKKTDIPVPEPRHRVGPKGVSSGISFPKLPFS